MDNLVVSSTATAILFSTPILIAGTGELLAERVGVYNIGIEGTMLVGGLGGVIAGKSTGSVLLGLLGAIVAGGVASLLFGVAVVVFRADMVVSGLGLLFLGQGITGVAGVDYVRTPLTTTIAPWRIPGLSDIPYVGHALFEQRWLVYVAFLLPVAAWWLIMRTRHGLAMRAIGESPSAADAAGIAVNRWRLFYVTVAGMFAGLGGAFLTLGTIGTWLNGVTAGEGWIAMTIVIFAGWRPIPLIAGALTFGGLGTLGDVAQALGWPVPSELFSALPYLGTLAILIFVAWQRTLAGAQPPWPAALGRPFFRGSD